MLKEANVQIVRSAGGVVTVGMLPKTKMIDNVAFENGYKVAAAVWIDASYEGGIAEKVCTMVWGREGKEVYNESAAGRKSGISISSHGTMINPYWDIDIIPYDVPSNVIPHVSSAVPAAVGSGDLWVQPFDFRLCFTGIHKAVDHNF